MIQRTLIASFAFAASTLPALAHPGHGSETYGLVAGFVHPLSGLDHLLAMIAVGLWAALLGSRAVVMVPAAFVACMLAGFGLAVAGVGLPGAEPWIAASVAVFGLLIAALIRLPLLPSLALVGTFATFHGHAHGAELAGTAAGFGLGFVVATIVLHGTGIVIGRQLLNGPGRIPLARVFGGAVAVTGLALMGGWA